MTKEEAIEILIAEAVCASPILSCDFCARCVVMGNHCTHPTDKEIEEAVLLLKGASKDASISALRQQETVTNRNGLTNADRINVMTIEEKADFLSSIAYGRETPWSEQFAEKFCKSCPTTTCIAEGYHHPLELHECDFRDGKCPHGGDIVWWLQQPAEEDDHA